MNAIRIALVDDEPDFREPVARYLRKKGMTVHEAGSIEALTPLLAEAGADILLLDINLPGESGLDAVERLRAETGAGVIMVTARGTLEDRIHGLNQGADGYLCKPVSLRELEAMVRSVWRRVAGRSAAVDGRSAPEEPEEGEWVFDANAWTLMSPGGEALRLSSAEYDVLSLLITNPGEPVPRDALFAALKRPSSGPEDRAIDILISRLRRKFSDSTFRLPIRSVRGVGYVFPPPVSVRRVVPHDGLI